MRSSDSTSCACGSNLGDIFVFLRSITAYANRPDYFSFVNYGHTTLQRRCTWQNERSYAPLADLIFKHLTWASDNRRCSRFTNSNLDARDLCVVESL